MKEIREYIESRLKEIDILLKKEENKKNLIELKSQYLDFIYLLKIYEQFKLTRREILKIAELPANFTDTSEYRIIEDADSEDRSWWHEIKINNKQFRLNSSDVVIKKK